VPLLLGKDRKKLSKRDGDVAVQEYIEKGYLPEAMVNFLTLLGWNPGTTQEIFSMDELITQFSMDRVQKAGAIFDVEKLDWLQGQWIRRLSAEDFAARILPFVAARFPAAAKDKAFAAKAMMIQSRVTLLSEAADMLAFVYEETLPTMELLANPKQKIVPEEVPQLLKELEGMLTHVDAKQWTTEELKTIFEKTDEVGRRKLLWILRAALTGKPFSPGAFEVAAMLGKEASLKRISLVLNATS
jgi:glutamyl/glutaminyl-tRNA synthetase